MDCILRDPRLSSFWISQNLSLHMDRQARTGDTVLIKSRTQTLPWWLGGVVKTTENKIHWHSCVLYFSLLLLKYIFPSHKKKDLMGCQEGALPSLDHKALRQDFNPLVYLKETGSRDSCCICWQKWV